MEKTKAIGIRLPVEIIRKLEKIAKEQKCSFNQLMNDIIEKEMKNENN